MAVEFDFSLEKVLKVRNIREDKALNKFVQARQKLRKIEEKLENKVSEQKELYDYIRNNNLPPETALYTRNCLYDNRKDIKKIRDELSAQMEKVEKFQKNFIEKRQKREAIDKLKDKEYEKFTKEYLHKEQIEVDDMAQHINNKLGV